MINNNLLSSVINNIDVGYWELDLNDNKSYWSAAFIEKLGYSVHDITIKLDYFLGNLIHKDDRDLFRDNFYGLVKHDAHFKQNISIRHNDGDYKEYVCKTNEELPINIKVNSKVIFFFEKKLKTHKKLKEDNFYYKETASMTSTGSWYVDFKNKKSYWDLETRKILGYPEDYIPSLKMASTLYAKEHQQLAADVFFNCAMTGKPFEIEIIMVRVDGSQFWAKAIGKPVYNDNKEVEGIRGVFQDIDDLKRKEIHLKKTSDVITSQNSRLFNFAHIVSHNLRSHSSNLSLIIQFIEEVDDVEEKMDLFKNVKEISKSLNTTIEHLNEVVTIQTNINQKFETVSFKKTLNQVKTSIGNIIKSSGASIEDDFSDVEEIRYIHAYLESIILNLLTNAIKYKHTERKPSISLRTYRDSNNKIVLEVRDNGVGIDLDKFGDKLFGMYKTFHYNEDAVGIGLFITKNQIESLDGKIEVESEVNIGTTFKITFQ